MDASTSTATPVHETMPDDTPASSFTADPRVHFDTRSGKWTFEADDGNEMEWEVGRGVWVPVLSESVLAAQQAAYSVAGVDEDAPVAATLVLQAKKRQAEEDEAAGLKGRKKGRGPAKVAVVRQTAVYVTNLPPTTTAEVLVTVFSKAGLILEDAKGEPKVKLYNDEAGNFKGEALVVYLKEESVELAIRLLDETELVLGGGDGEMKVAKAVFEKKDPVVGEEAKGNGKGKGKRTVEDKQKAGRRADKLKAKLADWSSDEEDAGTIAGRAKHSRVVVLQGMFTLKELEVDATLLLDLKEDVREECESLGTVTNVVLYDKEEDGIMTIRFKEEEAALACIAKMNGRFFSQRTIKAFSFDGTKKYKKGGQVDLLEGTGLGGDNGSVEEKEKERLEKYAEWLEKDGKE